MAPDNLANICDSIVEDIDLALSTTYSDPKTHNFAVCIENGKNACDVSDEPLNNGEQHLKMPFSSEKTIDTDVIASSLNEFESANSTDNMKLIDDVFSIIESSQTEDCIQNHVYNCDENTQNHTEEKRTSLKNESGIEIAESDSRHLSTSPKTSLNEINRCESPPSLKLHTETYSGIDYDENNDESSATNESIFGNKVEMSSSLPSINLESMESSPEPLDVVAFSEHADGDQKIELSKGGPTETSLEFNTKLDFQNVDDKDISDCDDADKATINTIHSDKIAMKTNQKVGTTDFDMFHPQDSFNDFDADFSQFATFESTSNLESADASDQGHISEHINSISLPVPNNVADENNDNGDENGEDDDDDFGEFSDFQQTSTVPSENSTQNISSVNMVHEFNKNAKISIDIEAVKSNLKSMLGTIFPLSHNDDVENNVNVKDARSFSSDIFMNDLTKHLKDVENSKAIAHQWANSTGKSSLVKSLGIDSRNIVNEDSDLFRFNDNAIITFNATHVFIIVFSFTI